MFPEETHAKIVARIDAIECEMFRMYRRLEALRLDLQAAWHVLPSGEKWSQTAHDASAHSSK